MRPAAGAAQSESAATLCPRPCAAAESLSWKLELEIRERANHAPLKFAGPVQVRALLGHLRCEPKRALQVVARIPVAGLFAQQVPIGLFGQLDQRQRFRRAVRPILQSLAHVQIAEIVERSLPERDAVALNQLLVRFYRLFVVAGRR